MNPHELKELLKLPFGRLLFTKDKGDSVRVSDLFFATHLEANHIRNGKVYDKYDLGSGLVTNVGVMAMANDWNTSASLNLSTLGTQNFHATGTGVTAAAATDIALQTLAAPTTATGVTGAQSSVFAANLQIFKNIATINYTSSLAITEWGLHSLATLSSATGSPFTAATATTATETGTALTASSATVRGQQQTIVVPATTTVWGFIKSNTTSVMTLADNGSTGWWNVSNGTAGSTPGNTEVYALKPVLWDHKVFAAINVVNLDSIQFTYSLTIASGG